jgi:hypothetical protein
MEANPSNAWDPSFRSGLSQQDNDHEQSCCHVHQ